MLRSLRKKVGLRIRSPRVHCPFDLRCGATEYVFQLVVKKIHFFLPDPSYYACRTSGTTGSKFSSCTLPILVVLSCYGLPLQDRNRHPFDEV